MAFVATVVAVLLTACTVQGSDVAPTPPPEGRIASATIVPVEPSVQEIPGQPPDVHYGTVDDAQIGVTYEYHLYVHCGLRYARFANRWWAANPPVDETFSGNSMNYLDGAMTLVSADAARFEWTDGRVDFVPSSRPPAPCA
ncbi:hypothetical protein [Pseudonocardia xinjiangensis]|uniref:Peptidase inhibitor family I36 n=1 Tax=Pseudonocardia xinjiangensis TaxID=75289 RepID=A0ABX1R9R7_9PSEU|nr:hypothetical protein [Pseudonocardia xinjiangensis]NMH76394.1 hypothetical protein [Pseudonocardia xinjiangensis]